MDRSWTDGFRQAGRDVDRKDRGFERSMVAGPTSWPWKENEKQDVLSKEEKKHGASWRNRVQEVAGNILRAREGVGEMHASARLPWKRLANRSKPRVPSQGARERLEDPS